MCVLASLDFMLEISIAVVDVVMIIMGIASIGKSMTISWTTKIIIIIIISVIFYLVVVTNLITSINLYRTSGAKSSGPHDSGVQAIRVRNGSYQIDSGAARAWPSPGSARNMAGRPRVNQGCQHVTSVTFGHLKKKLMLCLLPRRACRLFFEFFFVKSLKTSSFVDFVNKRMFCTLVAQCFLLSFQCFFIGSAVNALVIVVFCLSFASVV